MNSNTVQRLWRDEGLTVPVERRKKVAGVSTGTDIEVNAANMLWSIASWVFGANLIRRLTSVLFKIASMVDEHTRESLLHLVDRSITVVEVIQAITEVVEDRGALQMLRCANGPCVHFSCLA